MYMRTTIKSCNLMKGVYISSTRIQDNTVWCYASHIIANVTTYLTSVGACHKQGGSVRSFGQEITSSSVCNYLTATGVAPCYGVWCELDTGQPAISTNFVLMAEGGCPSGTFIDSEAGVTLDNHACGNMPGADGRSCRVEWCDNRTRKY